MAVGSAIRLGNVMGSARAETDGPMLERAFVHTPDYQALVTTTDFNYVVGRRGTGKSALYREVSRHYRAEKGYLVLAGKPHEHETLELQHYLTRLTASYSEMRAVAKLAWKVHLLLWAMPILRDHYKVIGSATHELIEKQATKHMDLLQDSSCSRVGNIVREAVRDSKSPKELPAKVVKRFSIAGLQDAVQAGLAEVRRSLAFFVDGLDEGWSPTAAATAVLGGLAAAVADFEEAQIGVHGTLFVRDNMFRALAHFDPDFSRHIEGSALRLHWDEHSLLELVGRRVQVALDLGDIENPEKAWNHLVADDLRGRDGFEKCLHHTLYRPRDILVLTNHAYVISKRRGEHRISDTSMEVAAKDISRDRLADLAKEYDRVLPGIRSFIDTFQERPAFDSVGNVVAHLEGEVAHGAYIEEADSDFALLGSGRQVLAALYGVGFLGYEDKSRGTYRFCHDGSGTEAGELTNDLTTVIHPCYWKALELTSEHDVTQVVVQINDEFGSTDQPDFRDVRVRRLGQVISELPKIVEGTDGAGDFEEWVLRAVKLLFAGRLANPALHPAPEAIQRRDVVATNVAEKGFWKRVREDYGAKQVIFEVKNYKDLKLDDYRQMLSYLSGEYGRFGVIVHRGSSEGISDRDRGWLQTLYHEHQRVLLTIPESILVRAISKLRNVSRHDYIEEQLSRRMDVFIRSYLSLRHVARYRRRKR